MIITRLFGLGVWVGLLLLLCLFDFGGFLVVDFVLLFGFGLLVILVFVLGGLLVWWIGCFVWIVSCFVVVSWV